MNSIIEKVKNEPVLVYTLVGSLIALAVAFGLRLSDVQTAAILAVCNAILAFVARSKVSPVANDPARDSESAF